MRPRVLLALALLTLPLGAQTTFDFPSRFGPPITQRFNINSAITLTLQYGPLGTVCSVRLAPPDRFPKQDNADNTMDSFDVTAALSEWLSPLGPPVSRTVTKDGTNSFEVASYAAGTLTRSYIGSQNERTLEATFAAHPDCLNVSRATVEASYGPPQYSSFTYDPEVIVHVTYDSHHAVIRMEIVSATPRAKHQPAPAIDSVSVDRLIGEVVPSDLRAGEPSVWAQATGRSHLERLRYPHVAIFRHFDDNDLTSVVVIWKERVGMLDFP